MKPFTYKSIILLAVAFVCSSSVSTQGQQLLSQVTADKASAEKNTQATELQESEIRDIADTIENPEKRQKLLKQLRILAKVVPDKYDTSQSSPPSTESKSQTAGSHWLADGLKTLWNHLSSPREIEHLLIRCMLTAILIGIMSSAWLLLKRKRLNKDKAPRWLRLTAGIVFILITVALIAWIWGLPLHKGFTSPTGQRFLTSAFTVAAIIFGGWVIWRVVNSHITKRTYAWSPQFEKNRRLQTLLPLFRNILRIIIFVVVIMLLLAELGINIAPLLAGAGVVGIAIGFGAQTMVKDILTGFMVLAENAISVDDWVIIGNYSGQVEGLTIRHIRMRDIHGNVHIVPWSSVEGVTNQTKDFAYAVFEAGFAYRENIDEVIEVIKTVAAEMRNDQELNKDILSELQVLGVIELGDSAVVVRTRFKTTPFKRWFLERRFRQLVKNRFDELGIEIPYPHTTLYFGESKQGTAPPARVQIKSNSPRDEKGATTRAPSEQ